MLDWECRRAQSRRAGLSASGRRRRGGGREQGRGLEPQPLHQQRVLRVHRPAEPAQPQPPSPCPLRRLVPRRLQPRPLAPAVRPVHSVRPVHLLLTLVRPVDLLLALEGELDEAAQLVVGRRERATAPAPRRATVEGAEEVEQRLRAEPPLRVAFAASAGSYARARADESGGRRRPPLCFVVIEVLEPGNFTITLTGRSQNVRIVSVCSSRGDDAFTGGGARRVLFEDWRSFREFMSSDQAAQPAPAEPLRI